MKRRDLEKLFKDNGWYFLRSGGNPMYIQMEKIQK